MAHCLIVAGPAACFPRVEMTTDQVTCDVITPIAGRAIFEALHWTPAIAWRVERIKVLHPIRTRWRERDGAGRALELIDVRYAIWARFDLTAQAGPRDNAGQHANMFKARARRRQFYRPPYLGRRDLAAEVEVAGKDEEPSSCYAGSGSVDLGWMPHDRDFGGDHRLLFYRPAMVDGVIDCDAVDRDRFAA